MPKAKRLKPLTTGGWIDKDVFSDDLFKETPKHTKKHRHKKKQTMEQARNKPTANNQAKRNTSKSNQTKHSNKETNNITPTRQNQTPTKKYTTTTTLCGFEINPEPLTKTITNTQQTIDPDNINSQLDMISSQDIKCPHCKALNDNCANIKYRDIIIHTVIDSFDIVGTEYYTNEGIKLHISKAYNKHGKRDLLDNTDYYELTKVVEPPTWVTEGVQQEAIRMIEGYALMINYRRKRKYKVMDYLDAQEQQKQQDNSKRANNNN